MNGGKSVKIYIENEEQRNNVFVDLRNDNDIIYLEEKQYSIKEIIDVIKVQDANYHKLAMEYDKLNEEKEKLEEKVYQLKEELNKYEDNDEEDYYEELKINELI